MCLKYSQALLFFVFIAFLSACSTRSRVDDSLAVYSKHKLAIAIKADCIDKGKFDINGSLSDSAGVIFSDSTRLFVNRVPMQFVVGTGNYYDKHPGYSLEYKFGKKIVDTLWFSVQFMGSSRQTIGYATTNSLADLRKDESIKEITHNKTQPLVINWAQSNPDSLVLIRGYCSKKDSNLLWDGGDNDVSTVHRHWDVTNPITLSPDYFKADTAIVTYLYLTWIKRNVGKITSPALFQGTIVAVSSKQQTVYLKN
jgi:hypothetical protein